MEQDDILRLEWRRTHPGKDEDYIARDGPRGVGQCRLRHLGLEGGAYVGKWSWGAMSLAGNIKSGTAETAWEGARLAEEAWFAWKEANAEALEKHRATFGD